MIYDKQNINIKSTTDNIKCGTKKPLFDRLKELISQHCLRVNRTKNWVCSNALLAIQLHTSVSDLLF